MSLAAAVPSAAPPQVQVLWQPWRPCRRVGKFKSIGFTSRAAVPVALSFGGIVTLGHLSRVRRQKQRKLQRAASRHRSPGFGSVLVQRLGSVQRAAGGSDVATMAGEEEEEDELDFDDDDDDDDDRFMQATPRERQFGYYDPGSSAASRGQQVELPLPQLHLVAAQRQLPLILEGVAKPNDAIAAWLDLLQACVEQAPELLGSWNVGVGPLLRLAAAIPRDQWRRSPREPWAASVRGEVFLQAQAKQRSIEEREEGPNAGAELLPLLEALLKHVLCDEYAPSSVLARAFIWSDGAGGVLRERPGREIVLCSGVGLQLCLRFIRLYSAVASGKEKPVAAAKQILTDALTKKMVRSFLNGPGADEFPKELAPLEIPDDSRHVQPVGVTLAGPLASMRMAQVEALGGTAAIGQAVAGRTRLGKNLGTLEEEEYVAAVLAWASRFADAPEFADELDVGRSIEWLLSQHATDPSFSLVLGGNPRAPKNVLAAASRAAASLELDRLQRSGQRFLPNPAGVKGFVKKGVLAPFGSPYEGSEPEWVNLFGMQRSALPQDVPNSWQGDEYEDCDLEDAFMKDTSKFRRATVRIDEIMSFDYLQHVGQEMANCLRVERRGGASLMKYLSRVKTRESSFWVMTITAEEEEGDDKKEGEQSSDNPGATQTAPVQHMLLMEVYNGMKVIHQAEGPHPRRWPRPDAWSWLQEWAAQEGLVPDGPEGVTVGPYRGYAGSQDPWDIRRCFLW